MRAFLSQAMEFVVFVGLVALGLVCVAVLASLLVDVLYALTCGVVGEWPGGYDCEVTLIPPVEEHP